MPLTNYSELQTSVAGWLNRSDLTAVIPDFVTLAEDEFNQRVRVSGNEERTTVAVVSGTVTLPTDFLAVKQVSDSFGELGYLTSAQYSNIEENQDNARFYTLVDGALRTSSVFSSLRLAYYAEIPPLATNSTNWLLTKSPNLYLFTTLSYAAVYLHDDAALAKYRGIAEAQLSLLKRDNNNRAGRLEVRAS